MTVGDLINRLMVLDPNKVVMLYVDEYVSKLTGIEEDEESLYFAADSGSDSYGYEPEELIYLT